MQLMAIDPDFGLERGKVYDLVEQDGSFVAVRDPETGKEYGWGFSDNIPTISLDRFTQVIRESANEAELQVIEVTYTCNSEKYKVSFDVQFTNNEFWVDWLDGSIVVNKCKGCGEKHRLVGASL